MICWRAPSRPAVSSGSTAPGRASVLLDSELREIRAVRPAARRRDLRGRHQRGQGAGRAAVRGRPGNSATHGAGGDRDDRDQRCRHRRRRIAGAAVKPGPRAPPSRRRDSGGACTASRPMVSGTRSGSRPTICRTTSPSRQTAACSSAPARRAGCSASRANRPAPRSWAASEPSRSPICRRPARACSMPARRTPAQIVRLGPGRAARGTLRVGGPRCADGVLVGHHHVEGQRDARQPARAVHAVRQQPDTGRHLERVERTVPERRTAIRSSARTPGSCSGRRS